MNDHEFQNRRTRHGVSYLINKCAPPDLQGDLWLQLYYGCDGKHRSTLDDNDAPPLQ